jgi:transcriptional regulator with XRE-family HTH domain
MDNKGYSRKFVDANIKADPFHVGVQLGRICIQRDIPVQDVAEYLNVSRQSVYLWFLGKTKPHPKKRELLWGLLNRLSAVTTT